MLWAHKAELPMRNTVQNFAELLQVITAEDSLTELQFVRDGDSEC